MATNFPTSIDSLTNPGSGDTLDSPDHAGQHSDVNDGMEAVQAKVGADSSAVTTSHDYKLGEVTSTDKAVGKTATQTLTNKTLTSPALSGLVDGWIAAGETWTYASADAPTYTFTISSFDATTKYSAGMKVKLDQSVDGTKYGFITKVTFDDPGSTITIYMGTDYDLDNAAITNPYYSTQKAPLGFPLDPAKWTVEVNDTTERSQLTPVQNTWYNLGSFSINVPIGSWDLGYDVYIFASTSSTTQASAEVTLCTANNSESDNKFTTAIRHVDTGRIDAQTISIENSVKKNRPLSLAVKDTYYLNSRAIAASQANLKNDNDQYTAIIRAVSTYL